MPLENEISFFKEAESYLESITSHIGSLYERYDNGESVREEIDEYGDIYNGVLKFEILLTYCWPTVWLVVESLFTNDVISVQYNYSYGSVIEKRYIDPGHPLWRLAEEKVLLVNH